MKTKICFKCGLEKPINDFYKHKQMGDGYLGKCKECTKKDSRKRYGEKIQDPKWHFKERARQAEKEQKRRKEGRAFIGNSGCNNWKDKFPEKRKAHSLCSHLPTKKGYNNHHWSYRIEDAKDVIVLKKEDHIRVHKYMQYDQEQMKYRRLDGVLISTKQEAKRYYKYILSLPKNTYPDYQSFDNDQ